MDSPWSDKETLKTKDRVVRLSKEISDFIKYIEPTKAEILNRDTLLYSISQIVESLWPNRYAITVFGSSVTGLAFPASDVDMNIDFDVLPQANKVSVLKSIRKLACKERIFSFPNTTLAANAKVPVLMATDENQVSIDISIDNECFSSDRTATWVKEYPALKPLFMVLKQAIGNFRVSNFPNFEPMSAKTAGLASYSLVCLIVNYIQLNEDITIHEKNSDYLGRLLLGFLSFYSTFDSSKAAIDPTDEGQYLSKNDCPIPLETKAGRLTIIDPDMPGVNVARSTSKFDTIKTIFKHAFDTLTKKINSSSSGESILSSVIKVENHYHQDPRREGSRFKVEQIWIENGNPLKKNKFLKNRFGGKIGGGAPYERDRERSMDRHIDRKPRGNNYHDDNSRKSRYDHDNYSRGNRYDPDSNPRGSRYHGGYKAEPYSRRFEDNQDYNAKEYRKHKKNNNSHLAEHYKNKYDKSKRR